MKKFFQVLISTMNDGIFNVTLNEDLDYLIVHQITNGSQDEYYEFVKNNFKNVQYVSCPNQKGLSLSRNIALSNSNAKYLLISDDDVILFTKPIRKVLDFFEENRNTDVFISSHTDDESYVFDGSQFSTRKLNVLNSFNVSSIDMFLRSDSIKDNYSFDESFGLGSDFPSGEEYIFTTDIIKGGSRVVKSSVITSYHPSDASGLDFYSSKNKVLAKKNMFIRVFGSLGYVMFLIFSLKKSKDIIKSGSFFKYIKFSIDKV